MAGVSRLRKVAVCAVSAVAVALPVGVLGTGAAQAATTAWHALASGWTPLTLQNGWSSSPFGTSAASVRTITGVVTVQAEGGAFSNAACFTSLDGVSFAP